MTPQLPKILDLPTLRGLYASGASKPETLLVALAERIADADPAVFITLADEACLAAQITALREHAPKPNGLPLWGVPFAVKDNIHVAGLTITAACPAFARMSRRDAEVVTRLKAAGAIVIGKTNLDQFATGLNGTRSPYGVPRSVFNPDYISGGSSSGSAVAVAAGLASFALGTDTAGSGRVPAAFNNIVGIKPTPGLLSTTGVLPACRSLDCVSIFAGTVADGAFIRRQMEGFDATDPYSLVADPRAFPAGPLRVGVLRPADREFFGDGEAASLYDAAIALASGQGHAITEICYAPLAETAALLYEGPWVAERNAAVQTFAVKDSDLDPSVAAIIMQGRDFTAVDAFRGQYRLAELRRRAEKLWKNVDLLLLPTAPTTYRVSDMLAQPILLNSRLGIYTNFFNLLGLAAIAVPAGFRRDGLPVGVTLAAPGGFDDALVPLASELHRQAGCGCGIAREMEVPAAAIAVLPADGDLLLLAVVGAHLSGMALNHELRALGGMLARACRTAADYRLYRLETTPPKPGLIHQPGFAGPGIALEIWALPAAAFGSFVENIPAPLGIGKITLDDGQGVSGFLCEASAVAPEREITEFGGWRAYVDAQRLQPGALVPLP